MSIPSEAVEHELAVRRPEAEFDIAVEDERVETFLFVFELPIVVLETLCTWVHAFGRFPPDDGAHCPLGE
jgi:hypothetical protein